MYIQMMVRRRFLNTYKRKKLSQFDSFNRHAIETVNQMFHSGDARFDATFGNELIQMSSKGCMGSLQYKL